MGGGEKSYTEHDNLLKVFFSLNEWALQVKANKVCVCVNQTDQKKKNVEYNKF